MNNVAKALLGNKEVKNAGWIIAGKVAQMILAFSVSIFTARYLGPDNYGLINYAGAFVAFSAPLCTLGINSVIIKDFADNPHEQGEATGTTIVLRAISSILSSFMIVGIVGIIDRGETETVIVTALCSAAPVFQIFDTINYWFQSRYQSKVTSIATLLAYAATSVYKIVLLVLQKDVIWFAFANSVDYMVLAIFLIKEYKKHDGPEFKFSWSKGKCLLEKSYHYILSGMMVAIYGQTDRLMLKHMLDETAVGYYSLAASVNTVWVFVLQAVIDSLYPAIMTLHKVGDRDAFDRKNRQLYTIVIYVSIFAAILFAFFGKFAIVLLYGKQYEPAAASLYIISGYTIFSYLGAARNAWIVCSDKQKYLKYMYFGAAVINIFLNFLFIPIWGAPGAAFASLITQISTSIILPCFIKDMRPNVRLMIEAFTLKDLRRKNHT